MRNNHLKGSEPTLEDIEDYNGTESSEKKITVWIVIATGILVAVLYGLFYSGDTISAPVMPIEQGVVGK